MWLRTRGKKKSPPDDQSGDARHDLARRGSEPAQAVTDRERGLADGVVLADLERARESARLHDGPIQQLSAVVIGIDRSERKLSRGEVEPALALLRQAHAELNDGVRTLRRMMLDLRGVRQPTFEVLRREVQDLAARISLDVSFDANDDTVVPAELVPVIWRLVHEALANVARHSGASCARVSIETDNTHIRVTVSDVGHGFDTRELVEAVHRGRVGLYAVRTRVEAAGGTFIVESTSGSTAVAATFQRFPGQGTS